jgi:hypothetical protein
MRMRQQKRMLPPQRKTTTPTLALTQGLMLLSTAGLTPQPQNRNPPPLTHHPTR